MDPIKVDFTGKGKGSAIRKPKNAALKILISLLGTVVGAVIAYYFMLPPINLKSYDFYIYAAFIVLLFIVFPSLILNFIRLQAEQFQFEIITIFRLGIKIFNNACFFDYFIEIICKVLKFSAERTHSERCT